MVVVVCALKKVVNNFEVKVDVPNGGLRFREKIDLRCVSFMQFPSSCIIVIR